ncbi:uncharacterized protein EV420DRAFT_1557422 [Desarmillaria tabescens]|uniref:Uncharacterized protein n=1 Tax=Armillaria tabescens TaxID=1929756 RepID=A0AA39MZZ1_ARMTA|nr:uncharacterized protein EV420DRAFT_1557422 [Desarmillaria tabescens]KAK0452897.1 hypothetical protein EV420DRAFT_1557422 [Desarmillaria tabescens]
MLALMNVLIGYLGASETYCFHRLGAANNLVIYKSGLGPGFRVQIPRVPRPSRAHLETLQGLGLTRSSARACNKEHISYLLTCIGIV